jgi:DNA-binding transcriptional LysR family regulator
MSRSKVLSSQIRQLEDALGVQLLERTSRGVALRAAGASFLEGARSTLAALDRTVTAAAATRSTLMLVCSSSSGTHQALADQPLMRGGPGAGRELAGEVPRRHQRPGR